MYTKSILLLLLLERERKKFTLRPSVLLAVLLLVATTIVAVVWYAQFVAVAVVDAVDEVIVVAVVHPFLSCCSVIGRISVEARPTAASTTSPL